MARVTHVKKAQQRYKTVPVMDPETGEQKKVPVMNSRTGQQKVRAKSGTPIFRRLTKEDKNQPLPPRTCGACGKPIEVGTPYKWVAPKLSGPYGGSKMYRHESCPNWTRGQLTSSKMGTIWDAQDQFDPGDSYDDINQALSDFAETVKEVASEYEDSATNIEDGFGHETYQSSELKERAEALEAWAEELESGIDEVTPDPCDKHEENVAHPDSAEQFDCEDCEQLWEDALQEMRDAAQDLTTQEP